jgi:hypothetical protein
MRCWIVKLPSEPSDVDRVPAFWPCNRLFGYFGCRNLPHALRDTVRSERRNPRNHSLISAPKSKAPEALRPLALSGCPYLRRTKHHPAKLNDESSVQPAFRTPAWLRLVLPVSGWFPPAASRLRPNPHRTYPRLSRPVMALALSFARLPPATEAACFRCPPESAPSISFRAACRLSSLRGRSPCGAHPLNSITLPASRPDASLPASSADRHPDRGRG